MMTKRLFSLAVGLALMVIMNGCSAKSDNRVVIYSSSEEFRNEHIMQRLKEQFPTYDITLQYQSTGNSAAKLKAEGIKTECDIVLELESSYMEMLKDNFASLEDYDFSEYLEDLVPSHKKYAPWYRISGSVMVNTETLQARGLTEPTSYDDLLKPEYKGLISMPSPKASSTGYMFLKGLVNSMGEKQAFDYFNKLSENILQFTSSGSGPVNALVQGEAAIGLGITYQAVNEINNEIPIKILFLEPGAPYSTGGIAMIEGRQNSKAVKDVFDFIYSTLVYEDKELFAPEAIFKNQQNNIFNYPKDIPYADMTGINNITEKERLLEKWTH